jgi:hypothetical protein
MALNFNLLSGGVSDLFGAAGDAAEASAYANAAKIDQQNAQLAQEGGDISKYQEQRKIYQTLGGTQAEVAGAGFANSGSSQDILRSGAQQGALAKAQIQVQTDINVNSYEEQAQANLGMENAAKAASAGGIAGGLLGIVGGLFGL